ncbi:MAG: SpoIVB peptidase [Oscillospiraceae bacterium]|nr:SpoIVB peptidase [Oscillospiraceae bacterium]
MKKFSANIMLCLIFSMCVLRTAYAEEIKVIPVGQAVGIRLYTDGLLVVGMAEVNGNNTAAQCGIKINDRIKEVNGEDALSSERFSEIINENPDGVTLDIMRGNQEIEIHAVPALSEDNIYRLGLWVRDSTAGIGTVTYYDPVSESFAALGHSINDADTGNILTVKSGNILNCDISSVTKSKRGNPGEINGVFEGNRIGNVLVNSRTGIFGKMVSNEFSDLREPVPIAAKEQIREGDAYILSDAFGGETKEYTIKIDKITNNADKGLIIEITDNTLLQMSGGIVQGMSGSPIIQDGRLVGAVTHVLVNNPKKGYGTLAESMIDVQIKSQM